VGSLHASTTVRFAYSMRFPRPAIVPCFVCTATWDLVVKTLCLVVRQGGGGASSFSDREPRSLGVEDGSGFLPVTADLDTDMGTELLLGQRRRRSGVTGQHNRTASAMMNRAEAALPERQDVDEGTPGHDAMHSRLAVRVGG
jgi:hypothetical protein